MPRPLRNIVPGVAVHLTQRGSNRAACFRRDSDYVLYLLHLRELSALLQCAVHAYCLMTNHVHLLISPPSTAACVALMKRLGQRYAQYFNRERYVLGCYRYIELNPVDAGIVNHPGRYTWSSYRANALGKDDSLISSHAAFLALGLDSMTRRAAYSALCDEKLEPSLLEAIHCGGV